MKRWFSTERGYALLLTLVIIIIFTFMAVSFTFLMVSGTKRSIIRENYTQAQELSEKGMQHIISAIESQLNTALGSSGLSTNDFVTTLEATLDQYLCDTDGNIRVEGLTTGSYDVCISEYENLIDESGEENELRKIVKFVSIGEADDRHKQTEFYMEIGSKSVPDALKYTLSTVEVDGEKKASDGNIYLHGGTEIFGDIKVGNHLFTSEYGPEWTNNIAYWDETTLPVLYNARGEGSSNIVLGGNLYQFSNKFYNDFTRYKYGENYYRSTSLSFYNNHLNWQISNQYYKQSTLNNMFANPTHLPKIVQRDWKGNDVNINDHINEGNNKVSSTTRTEKGDYFSNLKRDDIIRFSSNYSKEFWNNNSFKGGRIERGTWTDFRKGHHKFDTLYVKGNVYIGNGSTSYYTSNYENITIEGYTKDRGAQLFVDGNVIIQGANLSSNLTIYATGSISIKHTTIKGHTFSDGREGSLIVFSKGKIEVANNSLYKNTPSVLKGFFYSEDNLEMFGVGSNIKIHGGIAARRITLNAVRGNYYNELQDWYYAINPKSLASPSRLVVQYDTELIENFLRLNPPEPIIREIDPSKLKDRK